MEPIMKLGPQILNYGLRFKIMLIILLVPMLLKMRFLVGLKLMLNYALLSNLPFTHLPYTNDIQRLYSVCQNLLTVVAPKRLDGTMADYLGKLLALLHDFNELLPPASNPSKELKQRSKFFVLLGLHGLPGDYSHVRDQILGSPIVHNFTFFCSTLLRVPGKPKP